MAWSWSHTSEAYQNAENNLRRMRREELEIIFSEWRAAQGKHGRIDFSDPGFDQRKYNRAIDHAKTLPVSALADFIWERASDFATCDNGGFNAWMCPHGCGPHCVPFDLVELTAAD